IKQPSELRIICPLNDSLPYPEWEKKLNELWRSTAPHDVLKLTPRVNLVCSQLKPLEQLLNSKMKIKSYSNVQWTTISEFHNLDPEIKKRVDQLLKSYEECKRKQDLMMKSSHQSSTIENRRITEYFKRKR